VNPLILFYLGSHPDDQGRFLSDILQQDDLWFEICHDYIQWLFPNKLASRVTPDAPTINSAVEKAFLEDDLLRNHLTASFHRMLSFYGLKRTEEEIAKAENWNSGKGNWFTQNSHNNLRITRILKCLMTLGLKSEAVKFHEALCRLQQSESDCGIDAKAYKFWAEAVGG
jgi:hypothetical protein